MKEPLLYTDDVETVPPDESDDIRLLLDVLQQILRQTAKASGEQRRDVHVKSNGCAVGHLCIPPLDASLAQGLFATPATYPVLVRFSNSSPLPQPDAVPDGRGLAIQVQNVSGPLISHGDQAVQNFLMVNHPAFIVATVRDYLAIEQGRLASGGLKGKIRLLTRGRNNPLDWRWNGLKAFIRIVAQPPAHPATYAYYSMAPSRFGKWVAKYRVVPEASPRFPSWQTALGSLRKSDSIRSALAETLHADEIVMSFEIQLRTSEHSMPIEDASVEWPQSKSPYRQVARLILPRQEIDLAATEQINDVSFNVWQALQEHRPLGGINRLRREVYELSSRWRNAKPYLPTELDGDPQ